MKAFLSSILGYDPKGENMEGGVLGLIKGHYGCVEAQGRGTLHCHMLVWLEGGLNPNEIKKRVIKDGDEEFRDRLLAYLDDAIETHIPDDPQPGESPNVPSSTFHPCSVRGVAPGLSGNDLKVAKAKDLHHLAKNCQSHKHTSTCFKYWKGPPDPRECRFDLDESNFCPRSYIDIESEEICLQCLDGMVNDFNATILEAVRCNMDIKFIGSGEAAKAMLYYITDYITKSQLKAHVAFAALEMAVKKLGEFDPSEDDLTVRAKKLLQKCAYAMISHQELSAQQVSSYLMDYEDHFTSHEYRNFFWANFERYANDNDPSPECDRKLDESGENGNAKSACENEVDDVLADTNSSICENDDVAISTDESGHLIAKCGQIEDYRLRDRQLKDLCV
ncbi:hypothetical protein BJ138DRAFT_988267, partial [Hygrophoropsis aurantiaca]